MFDHILGGDKLKTVLMMVMRNATTDSPWPVSNNPFAKYHLRFCADCSLRTNCNLDWGKSQKPVTVNRSYVARPGGTPVWIGGSPSINRPESSRSSRITTRYEYVHVRSTAAIPGHRRLSSSNCENFCNH